MGGGNLAVGGGKILNFQVYLQDSILVVQTRCKYVFGLFWLEKTPPNNFRPLWASQKHFWPGWSSSMALNRNFHIFQGWRLIFWTPQKSLLKVFKKPRGTFQSLFWTLKNTLHTFISVIGPVEVILEPFWEALCWAKAGNQSPTLKYVEISI